MRKKIKVISLPTEESRIYKDCKNTLQLAHKKYSKGSLTGAVFQHFYVTLIRNLKPLKAWDWVIEIETKEVFQIKEVLQDNQMYLDTSGIVHHDNFDPWNCVRIIASTDPEITKPKSLQFGNSIMVDLNEDGSWYHAVDAPVDFSLSRKELIQRNILVPELSFESIEKFIADNSGDFEVECLVNSSSLEKNEDWYYDELEIKVNKDNSICINSSVKGKVYSAKKVNKIIGEVFKMHYDMHRRGAFDFPSKKEWVKKAVEMFSLNNSELFY
jgi:hypothetical protein